MTPDEYVQRLIEISNKKYMLLQDMLVLTKQQMLAITDEGMGALEKYISQKQVQIDAINKLDEEYGVYFLRLKQKLNIKELSELKEPSGLKGLKELKEFTQKVMEIVKEIYEFEKQNGDKAKALLDSFATEIKKLNEGKKVNSAYKAGPPRSGSYFIDSKK